MTQAPGAGRHSTDQPDRLRLSMRPLSSLQSNDRRPSAWAVFGWGMVALAALIALLFVLALLIFVNTGPPPAL